QRLLQALRILAAVRELQQVDRNDFLPDLVAAFGNQEGVEPSARAHPVVVVAGGADVLVLLQVVLVEDGVAAGALDPQAFRHAAPLVRIRGLDLRGQQFFQPAHLVLLRGIHESSAARMSVRKADRWGAICSRGWSSTTWMTLV